MIMYDLDKHESVHLMPVGTSGKISYERLVQVLTTSGEIRADEVVTHLWCRDDGIEYRVARRERDA